MTDIRGRVLVGTAVAGVALTLASALLSEPDEGFEGLLLVNAVLAGLNLLVVGGLWLARRWRGFRCLCAGAIVTLLVLATPLFFVGLVFGIWVCAAGLIIAVFTDPPPAREAT